VFLAGAIPADLATVKSTFFKMTVSLPSKTSVNKKFTKPQLIEEYLNTKYSLNCSNKTIQIMAAKIEALENEATLTAQIKKGIERHNVELPLFLNDCRKAITYAANKAQNISFNI
tara:strand:+ start:223 stop:567 length:345 start_codon:yes stop_codon:yes gene_type:complete